MAEHRIEITIDHDGKISAKSEGIKGPVCLDEIQELLSGLADLDSYGKTDDWYQAVENKNQTTRRITAGRR